MPPNLRDNIIQFLADRHEVFGSDLGFFIKRTNPEWGLKSEYRSLQAFVEAELNDHLKLIGKRGGNDIYRNITIQAPGPKALSGDDRTLWSLFSNPQREGVILLRDGALIEVDAGAVRGEVDREVPRVQASEYADLLHSAVERLPESLRDRFEEILKSKDPSPWAAALSLLRKSGTVSASRELEQMRIDYIKEQFATRLGALGLPQDRVDALAQQLDDSRTRREETKKPAAMPAAAAPVLAPGEGAASERNQLAMLRQVAKAAIDKMSAEQIRALDLPLGLVVDFMLARR